MSQLYLDMDGVLADFDKRAKEILGIPMACYEALHGKKKAWEKLQSTPQFYNSFDPMPGARGLVAAVRHHNPIVLTGVPLGGWAEQQKVDWINRFFGLDLGIITCRSKDKATYCKPGDVLIDDRTEYKHLWEQAGGHYIVHMHPAMSLWELHKLGWSVIL